MLIIKGLVEKIREEAHDVKEYAEAAVRTRMDDPQLADLYADLGAEEMKHAERLHKAAVDVINRYTSSGKEAPAVMRAIWDFEHQMMIEEMADAKRLLETVRS